MKGTHQKRKSAGLGCECVLVLVLGVARIPLGSPPEGLRELVGGERVGQKRWPLVLLLKIPGKYEREKNT